MRYRNLDDLRARCGPRAAEQAAAVLAEREKPAAQAPRKYRNEPVEHDGERFDSRHEYRVAVALRVKHGRENVIRQVSLPLGELRIRPDFLIIHERFPDGTFRAELVDAKGMMTDAWRAKANHLEAQHGLRIRLVSAKQAE